MAKRPTKNETVMASNISTGEERIDPHSDTAPGGQESEGETEDLEDGEETIETITEGEVISQEQWDAMTEEQKEAAAASAPTAQKAASKLTAVKGLKLQQFELQVLQALDAHVGEGESYEKEISWTVVPKEHRQQMRNFASRQLVYIDYDDDDRPLTVKFTPKGVASVTQPIMKADKGKAPTKSKADKPASSSPGRAGPRGLYSNPDLRIMRMVPRNPRREGTNGYEAWKLITDGMTYDQYLQADYDKEKKVDVGTPFTGPQSNHFTYDLMKGFVALYRQSAKDAGVPPYLEDGEPNYRFWAVRNELSPARILDGPAKTAKEAKVQAETNSDAEAEMLKAKQEAEAQASAEVSAAAN